MGCPTDVIIGDNLVFGIATHDPDTSELTDADSAPSYRIYEDEAGTPILTGNMAKLDDANTTGFYTELIACTAGNGFEDGKTYTIYIEATVGGATGGICYAFKAVDAEAERNLAADAVLLRNVSNVEATMPEHCLGTVVLAALEWQFVNGTLTIYRTDGSTPHATKTGTVSNTAQSVTKLT